LGQYDETCPEDPMRATVSRPAWLGLAMLAASSASAQQQQVVRPPQAQAWIDVATFSGFGMPAGGGNPMASLGGLFGGRGESRDGNTFGRTQTGQAGRWVDVTLSSRTNPALAEAEQTVPASFLDKPLKLQSPKEAKPAPAPADDGAVEPVQHERPRGKMMLYWGCGATVRPGQPKVLDMATAPPAELAQFFQSRRATQRGAHSASGRPDWPSPADTRMVPASASLAGAHAFTAQGLPASFKFNIPPAQDLMPPVNLQQQPADGATDLTWAALPTARAYFIAGMGANERQEMVIWTSSEVPDIGFGLLDYQTNASVDRWLGEKVLLSPATTRCTVPRGVFPEGGGGMLRMIAYGSELNLAHPPRPSDPAQAWEPEWAVKLRVKSMTTAMLGMPGDASGPPGQAQPPAADQPPAEDKKPKPLDILKGILGR
jgi:hypothetical protein